MNRLSRLGPGVMMAATAVGVSHLVQSTRAGAGYGLTPILLVALIVLLKYPAFRFAAEYAAVTGQSLVGAYVRMGRAATAWLLVTMSIELFVGTAVLSLVVAGMISGAMDLAVETRVLGIGVAILTAAVLWSGRYLTAERLVKLLVGVFSVMTLLTTIVAVTQLAATDAVLVAAVDPDRPTLAFAIAMTGYMPLPMAVAIFQSVWVREKRAVAGYTRRQAVFDLNLGWAVTALLAACFIVMGTAVLFQSGRTLPADAPGFAVALFAIFTELAGAWIYPILVAGGIAVTWSTLVALMDAVPRILAELAHELAGRKPAGAGGQRPYLVAQVAGAALVISLFRSRFADFLDVAAGLTFLIAPAVAFYNQRALALPEFADRASPASSLVHWNLVSVASFIVFAGAFLILRIV